LSRLTFVNLPVRDLTKSAAFFSALGFEFDPSFTDENATCMVVSDKAYVMLLVEPFFATFTTKEVADASTHTGVIMGVSAGSREDVDALVDRALELGGSVAKEPKDQGFMYGRSFYDLDGHAWEVIWMDPATIR
jgi:predicted lactoylglutathione lyase